ncbi:MAG: ATP-binding cassette domain-containing protein, partial [Planctomycetota bacterium]
MIRTEDLTKSFGSHQVLRGVSLEVSRGEVFGFVGPNGAGKSTFLKCLLGIVRPGGGTITLDGIDAVQDPLRARRRCGYAPGE